VDLFQVGFAEPVSVTSTDDTGAFRFCLTNPSPDNAVDLFARVRTCAGSNGPTCSQAGPFSVVVTNASNTIYTTTTPTVTDACTGTIDWKIVDYRPQHNGAQSIFNLLGADAFDYLDHTVAWKNTSRQQIVFPDTASRFSGDGIVHISSGDEHDPDVVLSSYALSVLYHLNGGSLPAVDCAGHGWNVSLDQTCAWLFGWAAFLQGAIQGNALIEDTAVPGGPPLLQIDMEEPSPGAAGSDQDGAVAATLWDIFDDVVDGSDQITYGLEEIWDVVSEHRPRTICDLRRRFKKLHDPDGETDPIFIQHGIDDCLNYVALGDSYSSGEGAPPYTPETDLPANKCHRSLDAYSAFTRAPDHQAFAREFIACSGATTDNVEIGGTPPGAASGEASQLDQVLPDDPSQLVVNAETDLVTITIGGNDAGFGWILKVCAVIPRCRTFVPPDSGGTMEDLFPALVEKVKTKVAGVYTDVVSSGRAPNASVFALGYPYLVGGLRNCADTAVFFRTLQLPAGLDVDEQQFVRELTDQLNNGLADVAAKVGIHFVPNTGPAPSLANHFAGHELCGYRDDPWFVRGLKSAPETGHPNARGQKAYADVLNALLRTKIDAASPSELNASGLPKNPPPVAAPTTARGRSASGVGALGSIDELTVEADAPTSCHTGGAFVAGQPLHVIGNGFGPDTMVSLGYAGSDGASAGLGTTQANATGQIDAAIVLPGTAPAPGAAILSATGPDPTGDLRLLLGTVGLVTSLSVDGDADGVPDACDNCPEVIQSDQNDSDSDGTGDACDACPGDAANDLDGDGLCADADPCPLDLHNDVDEDGVCGDVDNCAIDANPEQQDQDWDGRGDACDGITCFHVGAVPSPLDAATISLTPGNCQGILYQAGSAIELRADPVPGTVFTGWTGDVLSTANPLQITVTGDLNVTANFVQSGATPTPTLSPRPKSKCDMGKIQCVRKKQACILAVHAKAERKGKPTDSAALQKCTDAFDGGSEGFSKGCVGKLETKQNPQKPETLCTVTGDLATLEARVDSFVADAASEIDPGFAAAHPPNDCNAGKLTCVRSKADCLLKAHLKAVKKGTPPDNESSQKCHDAFNGGSEPTKSCIAKLDAKEKPNKPKTICTVKENAITLNAMIDAFVADVVGGIRGAPRVR